MYGFELQFEMRVRGIVRASAKMCVLRNDGHRVNAHRREVEDTCMMRQGDVVAEFEFPRHQYVDAVLNVAVISDAGAAQA